MTGAKQSFGMRRIGWRNTCIWEPGRTFPTGFTIRADKLCQYLALNPSSLSRLLDVIAERETIIAKDVAEVPELLDEAEDDMLSRLSRIERHSEGL